MNYDSFGNLSAIELDQSRASRKQLPNRLKINFDSSTKKNGKYLFITDSFTQMLTLIYFSFRS